MWNWLTGGVSKVIETAGTAVHKNYRTIKGDVAEKEAHINSEQLAVLNQYTAEFLQRPNKTAWDSFVDGLNRLPRPLLTFGIIWLFVWAWWNPGSWIDFISVLGIIPNDLWTLLTLVIAFFFGGRFVKEDLARPKLTAEQKSLALEIIRKRAEALEKAAAPDVVIAFPTPEPTLPPAKLPDLPADTGTAVAVDVMIDSLLQREGGYVDHASDRGGATNRGITIATLADWRGTPVTKDDVKALKATEAADIYRANYFLLPGIDTLPVGLQAHVFDICVNSGQRTAVRLLQRSLNSMGERLAVDGVIGDATRDACRKHDTGKINQALVEMRLRFYNDICAANPSQRVFLKGWERRARMFTSGPGIAA